MSRLFIEGITSLAELNPNKFTVIESLALEYIESKVHESLSWVERSLRVDKNLKDRGKAEEVLTYYRLLLSCCERMSSSALLKPVRGWVIQRDRKTIAKFLARAGVILEKYKLEG